MSSLSSGVRLLPGVQPDFLDVTEGLDDWHAELLRRITSRTQELADLHRRLEASRSRIAKPIASRWTAAQLQQAQAAAATAGIDRIRPAAVAVLLSPSATAKN